jgi:peptidoglycan LD-endopeptidase LytH
MRKSIGFVISAVVIILLVIVYFYFRRPEGNGRDLKLSEWFHNPLAHTDWMIHAGQRCSSAPFVFPTDGYIGYIWGDTFEPGHPHQGIDIFGGKQPGQTPVVAAYDGYLTRLPAWKSSVIIRIPSDPLQPARQIWTYYTHMADKDGNSWISLAFPAGTSEAAVKAGELLGYQGDFSGDPNNPVGVHLHFSIVLDDGTGHFRNELYQSNTIDPSPYFQLSLNSAQNKAEIPVCPTLTVVPE